MALSKITSSSITDNAIHGRRNLIINGAMQVSQRGTSVSSITSSGYKTVDRWKTNASGATYSQSQESVTVGGETGLPVQFTKFLKHNVTTGNDNTAIYQYVEDVTSIPSGNVTISFYTKGTTPDGGLKVRFWQNFGSGGSTELELTSEIQSFTLTSTWQRFTATITIPSISGKTVGTSSYFIIALGQGSSTSTDAWVLDVTGVQLEVGSQATPFEHRSYGEELALCQRYYYNHVNNSTGAIVGNGDFWSANQTTCLINFPISMRATPSMITENGGTNYYSVYSASVEHTVSNAWTLFLPQVNCANLYITPNTNGTAGNATRVRTNNASAFISFDSEL